MHSSKPNDYDHLATADHVNVVPDENIYTVASRDCSDPENKQRKQLGHISI